MKHTRTLFQLLILFVGSAFIVWELMPATDDEPVTQAVAYVPEWFGVDVRVIEMNEKGLPKREFHADKMLHYTEQNMTDLFNPSFTLFNDKKEPWHLSGNKGRTFHGKRTTDIDRLDLWQNVTLWQDRPDRPTHMTTSTIAIFPEQEFAQTDQAVSLKQPGQLLTGVGLKAFFDKQSVELFSQVRSEHAQSPSS
jgi:lipopolysaccharide export system protein LptC